MLKSKSHLSVLVSKLECLDQPQCLINTPTDGEVIDGDLSQRTLGVNDEQAAEGDAFILLEDPVGPADRHVFVG